MMLTPDEVLREPTSWYDYDWLGGWPDKYQTVEDAMDTLKRQLLEAREALRKFVAFCEKRGSDHVALYGSDTVSEWQEVKSSHNACLPESAEDRLGPAPWTSRHDPRFDPDKHHAVEPECEE